MKIRISLIYLIVFVLGVITAGILTGIYGSDVGVWISYSFLAFYGIVILFNITVLERLTEIKVESYEDEKKELTPEQAKSLPDTLGGEEKKIEEETVPPIEPPKEEQKKQVKLSEEDLARVKKVATYIKENLEKGHSLEKIREPLDKAYKPEFIEFVLQNAFKFEEPELPDLGEPEEVVTPETLDDEIKKQPEVITPIEKPKLKKEVKCPKCGKVCKSKGTLKNHMRLSKKCQS